MSRGRFITFEGIEGSGKSTQLKRLENWLTTRGFSVEVTREPGGTPLGREVRRLLLDPDSDGVDPQAELFLYLADRAQNMSRRVRPALEAGGIVLCDRHADATVVYQGVARGLGVDQARALNRLATDGFVPDWTLLFDLPVSAGLDRVSARRRSTGKRGDRMDEEPVDFHETIRQGYLDLARAEPSRFIIVDASGEEEAVERAVQAEIARRLGIK